MASASDVPGRFDVVINGEGYRFADVEERRAAYTYSPTFVQRTNVEGDYGDSQQEFWLTWTQRDWTAGEQQRFYRNSGASRFWKGTNINLNTPGQVTLRKTTSSTSFSATVLASATRAREAVSSFVVALSSSNLYQVDYQGGVADAGAHGLGAAPSSFGIATDGSGDVYLSTTTAGTNGVRKWDGASFTTFSATGSDALAFLNNTLFGIRNTSTACSLVRYDSAGTSTTIYSWLAADGGGGVYTSACRLANYGSKLAIGLFGMSGEVWLYDGSAAPTLLHQFPRNFNVWDMCQVYGILFISGTIVEENGVGRPAIFYYQDGRIGLLWQASGVLAFSTPSTAIAPAVCGYGGGLAFNDDTTGRLMFYDPAKGGVHAFGSYTVAGGPSQLAATILSLAHTRSQATAWYHPGASTATSGTVESSLIDFDSSLTKYFKAVKIDADIPTGATVDIAYQLETVAGNYTNVQTTAVSGTEYTIGQSGRAISLKITLNKGSSSEGPTLKRVYLRAAPIQQTFKRRDYVLDLSGRDGKHPLALRDQTQHTKDGHAMAQDLVTASVLTTPFSITDRFGTFTGVIEPDAFQLIEIRPEEYVATVRVREV